MKAFKALLATTSLVLLSLVFCLSSVAVAAPLETQEGTGFALKATLVALYPQGERAFSIVEDSALVEQSGYDYDGIRWAGNSVSYYVNLGKRDSAFLDGIQNSFAAWDAPSAFAATYKGSTRSAPGSLQAKWNPRRGTFTGALNVVGWKNLDGQFPGAIGVTYIWSYANTLVEVDTALNSSSQFRWWQFSGTSEEWPSSEDSTAYDVDVQNIMTHEAGHWLVLNDLYDEADALETMYGYAGEWELQKRSLEAGDIQGIKLIYGA